jgi:hypothetical protein
MPLPIHSFAEIGFVPPNSQLASFLQARLGKRSPRALAVPNEPNPISGHLNPISDELATPGQGAFVPPNPQLPSFLQPRLGKGSPCALAVPNEANPISGHSNPIFHELPPARLGTKELVPVCEPRPWGIHAILTKGAEPSPPAPRPADTLAERTQFPCNSMKGNNPNFRCRSHPPGPARPSLPQPGNHPRFPWPTRDIFATGPSIPLDLDENGSSLEKPADADYGPGSSRNGWRPIEPAC